MCIVSLQYVHEYEYTEEISGSLHLQVAIKSIPGLVIEGGASLDMNGVDKEFSESLEVTVRNTDRNIETLKFSLKVVW